MGEKTLKFHSRAARYTIRPEDKGYIRFAEGSDYLTSITTKFLDISMTGIAFMCPMDKAPRVGDELKVEIPIHNGASSVAWWARVVRVESYSENTWYLNKDLFDDGSTVFVAIHYDELPSLHRAEIQQELLNKFAQVEHENRVRFFKSTFENSLSKFWQIFLITTTAVFAVWFLWYFSQPTKTYSSEKGSPWGQRFPQFNFNKDSK